VAVGSQSTPQRTGHNNVVTKGNFQLVPDGPSKFCQSREILPSGTSAIRVSLMSNGVPGPGVRTTVSRGGQRITSGRLAGGWKDASATIPVRSVERTVPDARVCFVIGASTTATLLGSTASLASTWTNGPPGVDDRPPGDRVRIDYMSGGEGSWWSYAATVLDRIGQPGAIRGAWAGLLALMFMLIGVGAVTVLLLRDLASGATGDEAAAAEPTTPARSSRLAPIKRAVRRLPAAAWTCAAVAALSAATWGIISPPFQFPDEQDQFAYVQHIAETGKPPRSGTFEYSSELVAVLHASKFLSIRESNLNGPIWLDVERQRLDRQLARDPSRTDGRGAGTATNQPPLYYALAAVPYRVASGGTLLQRLMLIRLLSAFLAGLTALFAFLFVREALPAVPWAWTVGGLAVALQPLFGFATASAAPDSLLFTLSAALFYCVARAYRRGLSVRLGVVIGLVLAMGMLTKLSFFGLVPGATIGLMAIALRQAKGGRIAALKPAAATALAAVVPLVLLGILSSAAWGRPVSVLGSAVPTAVGHATGTGGGSLPEELAFIWQLYLPLPGSEAHIPLPAIPAKGVWLNGFVGSFGWITIKFPRWVTSIALLPALIALILAGIAVVRSWSALRPRLFELTVYALMIAGALAVVGAAQYGAYLINVPAWFGQSRYLLLLLAPFGAVLALASRGGGRRWGPVVGALVVLVALMHDIHSQLLVVTHFFG
jgi:hypothetical protein